VVNGCITVLPYSIGYVQLRIVPVYPPERTMGRNRENTSITLYPNPAGNFITLHDSKPSDETSKYRMEIRSSMGITLISEQLDNNGQINISGLTPGIYFITVTTPARKTYNTSLIKI